MDKFYTVKEIAELLQVKETTVQRHLAAGKMIGFKIGKDWRVKQEDLHRYIEENKK